MGWRERVLRIHGDLRAQLTLGELVFCYVWMLLTPVLAAGGGGLALSGSGTARGVGIGLLVVSLIVHAVPISPILQRRVRRRKEASTTEAP